MCPLWRWVWDALVNGFNAAQYLGREDHIGTCDVFLKLLEIGGADNRRQNKRPAVDISQRHLRGSQSVRLGEATVFSSGRFYSVTLVARKAGKECHSRTLWHVPITVLTRQQAHSQW